jgi:hypothetical protein
MTASTPQIGFRQFPPALKFVVVWFGILGLYNVLSFLNELRVFFSGLLLDTDHNLDVTPIAYAIIHFALLNGLLKKQNNSRIWASIFIGLSTLAELINFGLAIFVTPSQAVFWYRLLTYKIPTSQFQAIELLTLALVMNSIILFILLRHSTKVLFSRPLTSSPESTPQATQ